MKLPPVQIIGLLYGLSEVGLSLVRRSKSDSSSKDRGSLRLIWSVILISVALGVYIPNVLPQANFSHSPIWYPIGFSLFCFGIIIRWISIIYLGRSFTVDVAVATDQRVIDSGPYRLIRHPAYLGAVLAFCGLGICLHNLASVFLIVVPITAVFLYRIRVEEAALLSTLGEPYRAYSSRTKRLIPFVY